MAKWVWRIDVSENDNAPFHLHIRSTWDINQAVIDARAMLDKRYGKPRDENKGGGRWTAEECGFQFVGIVKTLELDDIDEEDET
jgi:hypothetical protein